jgi:hypothetical protein
MADAEGKGGCYFIHQKFMGEKANGWFGQKSPNS